MTTFLTCPSCACPAKRADACCPHCGAALSEGRPLTTPAAIVLGLVAGMALEGCTVTPVYGVPGTGGDPQTAGGGGEGGESSADGGAGGGGAQNGGGGEGGQGGFEGAPLYGVAGTGGAGGGR